MPFAALPVCSGTVWRGIIGWIGFLGRRGGRGRGRAREAEEGALALQLPALLRGEEGNLAVFAVVAPGDMDLSPAHLIQGMGQ